MEPRYFQHLIREDLESKMVFVAGPRQSGKTTLAKAILQNSADGVYFNLDNDSDRRTVFKRQWGDERDMVVFDELHKYGRWKRWLKGISDTRPGNQAYLVTGSARLDVYRRGGDSMLGRYHLWRLHPFSLSELPRSVPRHDAVARLMTLGGFPESLLSDNERAARRLRRERLERVFREDIRDLENIRNLSLVQTFLEALRSRVGSPVVLANLAADLEISPVTAKRWLELLERMYVVFTVWPLSKGLPRAVRKPPKVYFYDTGDVLGDEGARAENLAACELKKLAEFREDSEGYRVDLRYVRDKEGREIDFAWIEEGKLRELIEVKLSDDSPHRPLLYYSERLKPDKATQIVFNLKRSFSRGNFRTLSPLERFGDLLTPHEV
ncbi:MAG: ATP-binding protein [Acidobacteriota bacterium]|jgi:predicted AAA+ superfamily ATPase|nr:ATP-binding protein [Acidobacteriota bacterium]